MSRKSIEVIFIFPASMSWMKVIIAQFEKDGLSDHEAYLIDFKIFKIRCWLNEIN